MFLAIGKLVKLQYNTFLKHQSDVNLSVYYTYSHAVTTNMLVSKYSEFENK